MPFLEVIDSLGLGRHLAAALAGLPRLAAFLAFTPFLGGGNLLTGQMKAVFLLAFYIFIHPILLGQMPDANALLGLPILVLAGLMLKEAALGFLLAYVSGLVLWAVESAGFIMDNQRGASSAEAAAPISGGETSLLGAFLSQLLIYLFLIGGAFTAFLILLFETYLFWPPVSWLPRLISPALPLFIAGLAANLAVQVVLLAVPVLMAALLVDVSLGLINRFASQLNVYILAMPIKSGLAMLIVLIFLGRFVEMAPDLFNRMMRDLLALRQVLP